MDIQGSYCEWEMKFYQDKPNLDLVRMQNSDILSDDNWVTSGYGMRDDHGVLIVREKWTKY